MQSFPSRPLIGFLGCLIMNFGPSASAATNPRTEYEAILALNKAQLPDSLRSDESAKIVWLQRRSIELHDRGVAFLAEHQNHPLRWDTLVLLRYGRDHREKVYRSGFRQLLPVPESLAAWEAQYYPRLEALLRASDASPASRGEALRALVHHTSKRALQAPAEAAAAIPRVRAWLDQHDREFPRSSYAPTLYHSFAVLLDSADPAKCIAYLQELEQRYAGRDHIDQRVRELVAGRKRALQAQAQPIDELWTRLKQLDPVNGDPARYRGKLVLIALSPITYETVTERLEDYHAQYQHAGLALLQIAPFNRAYGLPSEPEQRANVERIVAKRGWPWPVLWNPKGHLEDIAGKWGYNTVPAWMLIGRDGLLVSDWSSPLSVSIPRELAKPAPAQP
jgi:hypothetical protein